MGYQIYEVGKRYGGYGVPAHCEHSECDEKIDRGMAYACGGEPFSEIGCDRYFCSKHRHNVGFKCDGSDERCDHKEDCECEFKEVCERCANGEQPFPYKPEHIDWIRHVLKDPSWKNWRKNNKDTVKEYKAQISRMEK